jgi:tellurite resistance protein
VVALLSRHVDRTDARPAHLVTANLFGIPFGVAGLAQCWSTAYALGFVPAWPGQLLWVVTALTYVVLLVLYLRNVVRTGRVGTEVGDRTFGPFTALVVIIPMLLGVALAGPAPRTGTTLFVASMILVALYGGWLSGQWIVQTVPLERWHPGYFLPTVAGPLLAAGGCATLGLPGLARVLFGYGLVCWVVLGSIILVRLFTLPLPPTPLVPTLAIELAPPRPAGTAWSPWPSCWPATRCSWSSCSCGWSSSTSGCPSWPGSGPTASPARRPSPRRSGG